MGDRFVDIKKVIIIQEQSCFFMVFLPKKQPRFVNTIENYADPVCADSISAAYKIAGGQVPGVWGGRAPPALSRGGPALGGL